LIADEIAVQMEAAIDAVTGKLGGVFRG